MTAKPLSAEEEKRWRSRDEAMYAPWNLAPRIWATLDASRAETAAAVRERDEARAGCAALLESRDAMGMAWKEVRGLAADLVEGLDLWNAYGCQICHGDCASANPPVGGCPVKLTYELKRRAAALGVGKQDGEKEKGNG